MRLALGLIALFALAACDDSATAGFGLFARAPSAPQVTSAVVTKSQVRIAGPYGFCVDPISTSKRPERAFVVFGNCAAISKSNDAPQPFVDAVALVSVSVLGEEESKALANPQALEQFLVSVPGRATLSRSGQADTVEIFDSFATSQAVYLRIKDDSRGGASGLDQAYWRGFRMLASAAVSVSVAGPEGQPLPPAAGLDLAREFVGNLSSVPAAEAEIPASG